MQARIIQNTDCFTEVVVNYKDVLGLWGKKDVILSKEIEILYKIGKGFEDYEINLRYDSESQSTLTLVPELAYYTGHTANGYKAMWLNTSLFYDVDKGEIFNLRLEAYNPKTYKFSYYDLGKNFCRPKENDETTAQGTGFTFGFKEYRGGENVDFYGSNPGIIVTAWPNLTVDGPYPDFQSIKIQLKDSTDTIYFTGTRTYAEQNGGVNWGEQEISKAVPPKYSSAATLSVYLVDKVGTSVLVGSRYYQHGRSSIGFKAGEIDFNPTPYNPHPKLNKSLIITHPIGNSPASPKSIEYSYSIKSVLVTPVTPAKSDGIGGMLEITCERASLYNVFPESDINGSGQIPITITAKNAFGDIATISATLRYDYYLKPDWDTDTNIKKIEIQHNFDGGDGKKILGGFLKEYSPSNPDTFQSDLRCFCTNESAILTLPKANDPNGGKIYYKIQHAIVEYTDGIPEKEGLIYKDLVTSHEGTEYNYKIPSLDAKDYCCYFRVCATNRISNAEYTNFKYSPLILLCRTSNPSFNISSVDVAFLNNKLAISFEKRGLDFGQSETFENYERNLAQFDSDLSLPSAKLKIMVDHQSDFGSGRVKEAVIESFSKIEGDWVFNIEIPSTWPANWQDQKIYIKLWLEVEYGTNSKVGSQPYIYFTIVNGTPTVAHRKNHVGINTTNFGAEDVLVVENVGNRKCIVLKGLVQGSSESHEIKINLLTGEITGAKINGAIIDGTVISGGNWS